MYGFRTTSFLFPDIQKDFRLFNFHSIQPAANDPQYTLKLLGENILNTFQSQLAFTYDSAEKFKTLVLAVLTVAFSLLCRPELIIHLTGEHLYHGKQVDFNELEPFAGFNIPLNLSKGRSFTYINFGSQYVYNQSNFKGVYKDTLGKIAYGYSSNFVIVLTSNSENIQQIFPQFAQTVTYYL